ncbi:MAG: hypothetical protein ACTHMM_10125 [Agriterribacter sp.]
MKYIFFYLLILIGYADAQVFNRQPQYNFTQRLAIGRESNNDSSAYLQIGPNSGANKGIGLPKLANVSALIGSPIEALFLYDASRKAPTYWNGTKWVYLDSLGSSTSIAPKTVFQYSDNINVTVVDTTTDLVLNQTTPNSGSRVVTLKSPSLPDYTDLRIYNYNNTVNLYTLSSNIIDFDGTFITTLENQTVYYLKSDNSYWRVVSKTKLITNEGGTGGSSGVDLINLD